MTGLQASVTFPRTERLATTRQIRNFSSGSFSPQPALGARGTRPDASCRRFGGPVRLGTEVLAEGTGKNEPSGLVTAARFSRRLGLVNGGSGKQGAGRGSAGEDPIAALETTVVIASLFLCMVLILLSAAGTDSPQKALAKRPPE